MKIGQVSPSWNFFPKNRDLAGRVGLHTALHFYRQARGQWPSSPHSHRCKPYSCGRISAQNQICFGAIFIKIDFFLIFFEKFLIILLIFLPKRDKVIAPFFNHRVPRYPLIFLIFFKVLAAIFDFWQIFLAKMLKSS